MKTLIVTLMLAGLLFAECTGPKDQRVRLHAHFKNEGEVSQLLFASVIKERLNSTPHVCVVQGTSAEPTYFVDIAGTSLDGQIFAVSIAWGPGLYVSHNVATFGNDSNQVRDIARLMVDDIAEYATPK
jgi:hypothetical protein